MFFMQPAIYVTSLAAVEVLRARDGGQDVINSVDVTCGLSLGEYTALAFAGAFRYSFRSIQKHSFVMSNHLHRGMNKAYMIIDKLTFAAVTWI
jgi:malonyl CoA-acyl carrier protein transacylase